ncbi:MAG: hypothetical protein H8K10_02100 [Nitrospira sp.]|nr:hypothetical protein [Nitrospira sp.]
MTCTRCGGLFRVEQVLGRRGRPLLRLLACFGCGNRLDETIALNHAMAREQAHEAAVTRDWKDRLWADVVALNTRRVTA